MKQIPIWSGRGNFPILVGFALVDDEHAVMLSRFHYTLFDGYAKRREGTKNVFLHHDVAKLMLWPVPVGADIDHEDRNRLNNQSSNLRVVTRSVNNANSGLPVHNTSGYKGVSWNKECQKWRAQIQVNGKNSHLGLFTDIHDAARKVNAAYRYHFPEVPVPNPGVESNGTDVKGVEHNDKAEN